LVEAARSKKKNPGELRFSGIQEFPFRRNPELVFSGVCLNRQEKNMGAKARGALGALTVIFLLGACPQEGGGDLPFIPPEIPAKAVTVAPFPAVKALCYIDVEQYNPLNAGDYILAANGAPFFDYVVFGAAQIRYSERRGPWVYLPPGLKYVLEHWVDYVKPLKLKGIQVLLGVTGGGENYSFGSLDDDAVHYFTGELMDILTHYGLDGFEFYDAGAASPEGNFYPDELNEAELAALKADFDRDGEIDVLGGLDLNDLTGDDIIDTEDLRAYAWYYGGDKMNNLMYYLRLELNKVSGNAVYPRTIIVREENFGRYFPLDVSGSSGGADFVTSPLQTDYFVNPYFDKFVSDSAQREPGGDPNYPLFGDNRYQYAPMAVDLGADLSSLPLASWCGYFKNGGNSDDPDAIVSGACDYGLLYFYDLRAASEKDNLASISLISESLFGSGVIRPSGGNYKKTW
jgi:hypothetical protein